MKKLNTLGRAVPFSLLIASILLAPLVISPLHAQVLYGSVTGTITDRSGAVLAGAKVTISSPSTGLTQQTVTDAAGIYRVLDLPPGDYTIEVSAAGFKPLKVANVPVALGQVNAENLQMEVGTATEQVTVDASAVSLQTEKADVHTEISSYAIENMPLNSFRNFQGAELLTPGVFSTSGISNSYPNSSADSPDRSFSITSNGMPDHANTTRVDGATNLFIWLPNHMLVIPPQDSISEVNVQTADFDVEKGLTAGAAVDVTTKSGSNQLHGSLYLYHTENGFNAKNWFNGSKSTGLLNNVGATVGGPVKKDKLFYFLNWDDSWQHAAEGFSDTVPTDDIKSGDFSAYLGAPVPGQTVCTTEGGTVPLQQGMVFDPATGVQSGPGIGENRCVFSSGGKLNVIPGTRLNAGAMTFNKLIPEPTLNVGPVVFASPHNYIRTKAAHLLGRNIGTARVDWSRSQNHVIWAKWTIQQNNFLEPFDLGDAGGNGSGSAYQRAQVATLGHSWTLSPRLVLTGHVGFDRMTEFATPPGYGKPLGESLLGIAGTNTPSGDVRYTGLPGITIDGFTGMGSLNSWEPAQRNDWTSTTAHNLTWIKNKHEFRMGVDISHNHLNAFQPEIFCCPRGNVIEDEGATALNTGNLPGVTLSPDAQNSFAAWDLGLISEGQNDAQYIKSTGKDTQYALYFGDRWKLAKNFTADLGLRWEYFPLITRDGREKLERFDTASGSLLLGGLGGNPTHLGMTTSHKLFSPRIGLNYQFDSQTVIRAGFGIANDTTPLERPLRGFYPLAIGSDLYDTSEPACKQQASPASCFGLPAGHGTFAGGVPVIQPPPISSSGSLDVGAIDNTLTIGTLGPGEFKRGYVESWNLFVERQLPMNVDLNVGYVGNHFVHEMNGRDLSAGHLGQSSPPSYGPPCPNSDPGTCQYFGGLYQFQGYLDSHYNSLQVSVTRRVGQGLFVQGAYTWSKAMGYVNDDTWENSLTFNCPECQEYNRGPLSFDHTHNLKLAYVYDLPFGKKVGTGNKVVNYAIGGWKTSGVFSAFSGAPLQLNQSVNNINTFDTSPMPNHVAHVHYLGGARNPAGNVQWFDPSAFAPNLSSCPTTGGCSLSVLGNMHRTQSWLRGPGLWQIDASLARDFKITERFIFELRGEGQNLFNTVHFNDPTGLTCAGSDATCGGDLGHITTSYGERIVQVSSHLRF